MKKKMMKRLLYILSFFITLQVAIPAYVNSTFIEQFLPSDKFVSYLYTLSAILTIVTLVWMPLFLKKAGNLITTFLIVILSFVSLLALAFSQIHSLVIASFVLHLILTSVIYFNLDIFLEQQSKNSETGNIRGIYLTVINTAWLCSPLLVSFILTNGDYWKIYSIALLALLPVLSLIAFAFKPFKDPHYTKTTFLEIIKSLKQTKNIYRIFILKLLLNFFYAWMVIYTPIHLYKNIGFDWQTIGVIFTIMLLPFVIFELFLGNLADKICGEKEILNLGIIIMAFSTGILSFLTNQSFWVWAGLLFLTRVGASAVEISSESYFFKQINAQDTNMISLFRIATPLAYVFAPLVATFFLWFVDFRYLFFILGIIMLFGLRYSLFLKDTK